MKLGHIAKKAKRSISSVKKKISSTIKPVLNNPNKQASKIVGLSKLGIGAFSKDISKLEAPYKVLKSMHKTGVLDLIPGGSYVSSAISAGQKGSKLYKDLNKGKSKIKPVGKLIKKGWNGYLNSLKTDNPLSTTSDKIQQSYGLMQSGNDEGALEEMAPMLAEDAFLLA